MAMRGYISEVELTMDMKKYKKYIKTLENLYNKKKFAIYDNIYILHKRKSNQITNKKSKNAVL